MDEDIKMVDSIVSLAYNLKPKKPVKIGKTRAETEKIIGDGVTSIQKRLIGYKCTRQATRESKDSKAIADRAAELIDIELKRIGRE